jgi:hypothetical protein
MTAGTYIFLIATLRRSRRGSNPDHPSGYSEVPKARQIVSALLKKVTPLFGPVIVLGRSFLYPAPFTRLKAQSL